jgi:hypothetical protein
MQVRSRMGWPGRCGGEALAAVLTTFILRGKTNYRFPVTDILTRRIRQRLNQTHKPLSAERGAICEYVV